MTPWSADKRGGCGFDAPPTHIPPEGLAIVGFLSDQFLRSRAWTSSPTRHSYGGQDRFGQPRPSATIMTFEPLPILVHLTPVPLSSLGRNYRPERLVLIPVCCAHPVRSTVAAKCRPRYHPPSRPGSAASRWSAICMKVCRSSARLRPDPGDCFDTSGWISAHCASVSSCRLMPSI
jgi:hypothetical protein